MDSSLIDNPLINALHNGGSQSDGTSRPALQTLLDRRSEPEKHRPLSVKEAAAIIGVSAQRLAYFIRRGDLLADTLNGRDYVVDRRELQEFNAQRRTSPGHPSFAELAEREKRRKINESRIKRLAQRRQELQQARAEERAESLGAS